MKLTNLSETRDHQRGPMNIVPCRVEDFLTSCVTVSFSRTILLCGTVYDVIGARMILSQKLVVKTAVSVLCDYYLYFERDSFES